MFPTFMLGRCKICRGSEEICKRSLAMILPLDCTSPAYANQCRRTEARVREGSFEHPMPTAGRIESCDISCQETSSKASSNFSSKEFAGPIQKPAQLRCVLLFFFLRTFTRTVRCHELPRNSPRTNDMKLLHLHHMHMYIYAHTYIVYTYTHTHVYAYALARETGCRTRNPGEIVPKELRLSYVQKRNLKTKFRLKTKFG